MSDRILTFEPGTSLVWNASLRSLHSALLLTGGPDLAREFWLGHPLESRGAPLTGAELFEYVWEERSLTPLDYQLRVLDSVEAFCLHRDMDFVPFVRERVFQRQRGTVLSARGSLVLAGRILLQLVRTRDLHHTILEVLDTRGVASPLFHLKGRAMARGEFTRSLALKYVHEQLHIVLDAARQLGLNLPAAEASCKVYGKAVEEGWGEEDFSAVIKALR